MVKSRLRAAAVSAGMLGAASAAAPAATTPVVTLTTIASNAYGTGDVNSCAIDVNTLTTYGGYQFGAYYDTSRNIVIARRVTGSSTWQNFNSGISISATDIADDHDVIAIAVDSTGRLSMSWNMHNVALNYAQSTASVLSSSLSSISFNQLNSTIAPTLFPNHGTASDTTNEVTYPQFYHIPGSNNLIFTYRNGSVGGGSGNGNQYFDIFNPTTNTWGQTFVINGESTSVNGYLNSLAFTTTGNLLATWTWRSSPAYQTNHNILFAQSPDNGATWYQQGGTTQYGLPIVESGTTTNTVAQIIKTIPQNSSLINQTSMTVDKFDRPMVATWWDPTSTTGDPNKTYVSGDLNRQYMLEYYTGSAWVTSQVSTRTSDNATDTSAADVRNLGRPIVIVDKQNRILMITRSEDTAMGSAATPATKNNIVVYYTTDSMTAGTLPSQLHWNSITLDSANMGLWEPTYDSALWDSTNTLDLFYEPVGLTGETSHSISVLEWNEAAFFSTPEPGTLCLVGGVLLMPLLRRSRVAQ